MFATVIIVRKIDLILNKMPAYTGKGSKGYKKPASPANILEALGITPQATIGQQRSGKTQTQTPLERAPIGTPMILNGILGYKGVKQSGEFKGAPMWIRRADMESENIPTYTPKTGYVYETPSLTPRTPGDVVPVVTGLTPGGEVDRTQSDEYKSIRAQYDALRKRGEFAMMPEGMQEKAVDYGMQKFGELYPTLAAHQQAGSFNPLMQSTFGYQTGEAPDQVQRSMVIGGQRYDVDPEGIQYQIDQQQMQDMDTGNPLMQSAMQQQRTADQAAEATTTGMNRPIIDRADEFIEMSKKGFPAMQNSYNFPTERLF